MLRLRLFYLLFLSVLTCGCNREKITPQNDPLGSNEAPYSDLSQPPVSVRWAESEPAPNLIEASVVGSSERIFLHPESIITAEDILHADGVISVSTHEPILMLLFTPEGEKKIATASSQGIGRRMALVIDGRVICALRVRGAIQKGAAIEGSFDLAECKRLAERIEHHREKQNP